MASSLTVAAEGRRVTVRVTPMQPLSAIVAAAAAALSPPVADPSTCVLRVNGKALSPAELGTPVRFANLSAATAKLELVTGRERGLGVAGGVVEKRSEEGLSTTAGPSSSSAAAAVPQQAGPPPPPVPAVTLPPAAAGAAGAAASAGAGPSSSPATAPPAAPAPAAAAPTGAAAAAPPAAPPPPVPRAVAAPAPSPAALLPPRAPLPPPPKPADPPAVVIEASVRTHLSAPGGGVAGLGLEEASVAVFSRDDLERAAAAARGGVPLDALASPSSNPPDSFFEFTPEDYRAVLGSYRGGHEAAAASAPLKTAQQRAAEAAARAAAAGDVRLRVHFSDRSILQFRLPATAPLGVLREVVSRALERRGTGGGGESGGGESGGGGGGGGGVGASTSSSNAPAHLAPWEWEIYTAPPQTVLKAADDARETLFSLGLSPAANIHCGPATASSSSAGAGAAKSSTTTTTTTMKEAPRLRPELLALRRSGVVPGAAEAEREAARAKAEREEMEAKAGGGGGGGSGAASAAAAGGSNNNNGKGKAGMPKWMKMGK